MVLLKFNLESFLSSYALENIFPGITIDKYWSDAVKLTVKQLMAVVANKLNVDFAILKSDSLIFLKAPIASITPPKIIAHITSHIVSSIPDIPPDVKRSFKNGVFVSIIVFETIEFMIIS